MMIVYTDFEKAFDSAVSRVPLNTAWRIGEGGQPWCLVCEHTSQSIILILIFATVVLGTTLLVRDNNLYNLD
jgi:hypothetical protein